MTGDPTEKMHAFVDSTFIDNLMAHADIRNSFQYVDGAALRDRTAGRSIDFAGCTFEEYRQLSGPTALLAAGKGIMFPIGAGIFQSRYAPADYNSTVSTPGIPLYARVFPDPDGERWTRLEVQSNCLHVNVDSSCVLTLDDGM